MELGVVLGEVDAKRRSWVEVMPTATNNRNGKWLFTITRADLETYAQSIRDRPGLIPIDYDHAAGSSVAAGWFTGQAEVRDTDRGPLLVAEVEWTPQGSQDVRDGRYRRISPEFTFAEKDAKTGLMTRAKSLLAATLTNRPHFGILEPVTANQKGMAMDAREKFTVRTGDLGPKYDITPDEKGLELHVRAEELLRERLAARGSTSGYTADEYLWALGEAERERDALTVNA